MTDRMSNPTEVLRNIADLQAVARRKGDQQEVSHLTTITNQIQTIWAAQGGKA